LKKKIGVKKNKIFGVKNGKYLV